MTNFYAQSNDEQLEFTIENDKLFLDDKYYTSGLFITYKKDLKSNFIFKKTQDNSLQLNITLGNETYTPSNLRSTDTRDFDRPYAGWLFVKTEVSKIKENSAFFLAAETGITGEPSLSGKLQVWAHEFFNIDVPTWTQEIETKFLVNLKAKYIYNKNLGNAQAFQYVVEPTLGTKDINVSNSLQYTFGKLGAFKNSTRNGFIASSTTNEFYGFLGLGYRYVLHNTLIQGSLDYEDETFTSARTPHLFLVKAGTTLRFKKSTINLTLNFNSKETPTSDYHAYGSLRFSQNF